MAQLHCGCRHLIKVDIDDYFGRVGERTVYDIFLGLGYSKLVAFELSRICTYHRTLTTVHRQYRGRPYSIAAYQPNDQGVLPQGSPTSPALSNLAALDLDSSLSEFAAAHGLVYSRYADDLVFSSRRRLSKRDSSLLVYGVYRELEQHGLPPNRRKTVVAGPGARRVVLGLLVDGDTPRLTRSFRERLDLHVHYVSKNGFAAQAKARGFSSGEGLRRHLDGLVAFAMGVNRQYGLRLREALNNSPP